MGKRKAAPRTKRGENPKKPRRTRIGLRTLLAALLFFGAVYLRDNVPEAKVYLERCLTESIDVSVFLEQKGL